MSKIKYSAIKAAFSPGDVIYVLMEDEQFAPVKVLSIERKAFVTEVGKVLFEDHDWLWRRCEQGIGGTEECG